MKIYMIHTFVLGVFQLAQKNIPEG